jgi:hypothetical protein
MRDFIVSSESLFPCRRSDAILNGSGAERFNPVVIVTTQFSLPFKHVAKSERLKWLKYRLAYFRNSVYASMELQDLGGCKGNITWLVFITKGDKGLLALEHHETLANGILLIWIEVNPQANVEDDYYRNIVMANVSESAARLAQKSYIKDQMNAFARIDSDDYVSRDYIQTIYCTGEQIRRKGLTDVYTSFPCGLIYDVKSRSISTHIWPESPFMVFFTSSQRLKGNIWRWPHDKVSCYAQNRQIITTRPMWCISVNHGNMANKLTSYWDKPHMATPQDIVRDL